MSATDVRIGGSRAWIHATRPPTLPAAIVPAPVGAVAARQAGDFSARVFIATLAGLLLIQVGTNFANDYYDFRRTARTPTNVSGLGLNLRCRHSPIRRPFSEPHCCRSDSRR